MLNLLLQSIMSVQLVYSVQLTCIDSNYGQRVTYVECVTVQHTECTENVQCATELY